MAEKIYDESDFDEEDKDADEDYFSKKEKETRGRPKKLIKAEPEDEDEEEDDEDEAVVKTSKPSLNAAKPSSRNKSPRYVAGVVQAREGVYDTEKDEYLAETIWAALADIKNDLEQIKKNTTV